MKNLKIPIFIIMIVSLLYWISQNHTKQIQLLPNQISKIETTSATQDKPKPKIKDSKQKSLDALFERPLPVKDKKSVKTSNQTFISAFRDFHFFLNCREIIEKISSDKDPMEYYDQRVKTTEKFGLIGGKEHEEYFQKFIDKCENLLANDFETYSIAAKRLQEEYLGIKPVSQEEIDLSQTLQLLEELRISQQNLSKIKKDSSTLSKTVLDQLDRELAMLRAENNRLLKIERKNSDNNIDETVENNMKRMLEINRFKSSNSIKELDKTSVLNNKISELKKQLYDNSKTNQSPDALLYITYFRIYDRNLSANISLEVNNWYKEITEQALEIKQFNYNFATILSNYSIPLFACSMNYPCDSDSLIIWDLCISKAIEDACGQSVESYFLNQYISPNLQADVNSLLIYLLNNYAQIK